MRRFNVDELAAALAQQGIRITDRDAMQECLEHANRYRDQLLAMAVEARMAQHMGDMDKAMEISHAMRRLADEAERELWRLIPDSALDDV